MFVCVSVPFEFLEKSLERVMGVLVFMQLS